MPWVPGVWRGREYRAGAYTSGAAQAQRLADHVTDLPTVSVT